MEASNRSPKRYSAAFPVIRNGRLYFKITRFYGAYRLFRAIAQAAVQAKKKRKREKIRLTG